MTNNVEHSIRARSTIAAPTRLVTTPRLHNHLPISTAMRLSFILSKAVGKFSARSTTMEFDLLNLPNELIIRVVELVDSLKALSRLACCSKRMQELAEPILYQNLLVKDASSAKALIDAFKGRPKRALAVHNLNVPSHQSMERQMNGLKFLLKELHGLRNLKFESPFVNTHNFESQDVWTSMTNELFQPFCQAVLPNAPSPRPLQKLTHCTYWAP